MTSYNRALEITRWGGIETSSRLRIWLPKRVVFENLEGAVRKGRGGKEKEWTDCVQSNIRMFGIAGDWKATALEAAVLFEPVMEGGRRFMTAWRNVDATRHRQEMREATRLEKLLLHTEA